MNFINKSTIGLITGGLVGYSLTKLWEYFSNPAEVKDNTQKVSGTVFKTGKAAGQLTDGIIYIVETEDDALITIVQNYLTVCAENGEKDTWCFEHDAQYISKDEIREESEALFAEIDNYNVLIPLFTPNSLERHFLLAKVTSEDVVDVIPELISRSEEIVKASMMDALHNLALQEPETAGELMKSMTVDESGDKSLKWSGIFCAALRTPIVPIAAVFDSVLYDKKEKSEAKGELYFNNYLRNFDLLKALEDKKYLGHELSPKEKACQNEILTQIEFVEKEVCGNKNAVTFLHSELKRKIKEEREEFYLNCINRYSIAKQCPLIVGIKDANEGAIGRNVRKQFRVFIRYEEKEVFVDFGRELSGLVYMMYLIDRKNKRELASEIIFDNNEAAFVNLYKIVNHVKIDSVAEEEFQKVSPHWEQNHLDQNNMPKKRKNERD